MYGKLVVILCVASLANAAPKPQWPAQAPQAIPAIPYTSQAGPAATYGPVASFAGTPVLTKAYSGPTVTSYSMTPGSKGSVPYASGARSNGQAYTTVQYSANPVATAKGTMPGVSYSYTTPAVQYANGPGYSTAPYSAAPAASTYQSVPGYPAGYPGAVAYTGAGGFPGVSGYPGVSDYTGVSGYPGLSGYPGAAQYTVPQPQYTDAAGYNAGRYLGYSGATAHTAPQYTGAATFPGAQTYTGAPAYTSGYPGHQSPIQYSSAPAVSSVNYNGLDGSYAW